MTCTDKAQLKSGQCHAEVCRGFPQSHHANAGTVQQNLPKGKPTLKSPERRLKNSKQNSCYVEMVVKARLEYSHP
jgi:hypothetical protein